MLAMTLKKLYDKRNAYNETKKDIEINHTLNKIHYLNSRDGEEYRMRSYYDSLTNNYHFNYLGYSQIYNEIENVRLLREASSPFDLKTEWILEKSVKRECVEIINPNQKSKDLFSNNIQPLLNIVFDCSVKKNEIKFKKLFSSVYWEAYPKVKGERSDRALSMEVIKKKLIDKDLPFYIHEDGKNVILKEIKKDSD